MLNNGAKWYNFSPPRWSFIAPPLTDRGGGVEEVEAAEPLQEIA